MERKKGITVAKVAKMDEANSGRRAAARKAATDKRNVAKKKAEPVDV